jgi:hypothetical protein
MPRQASQQYLQQRTVPFGLTVPATPVRSFMGAEYNQASCEGREYVVRKKAQSSQVKHQRTPRQ